MNQQQAFNELDSNRFFRVINSKIFDSELIIQLKILKYTLKVSIKNETEILKELLQEINIGERSCLTYLNACLIVDFFHYPKKNQNEELKNYLQQFKKNDENKMLLKNDKEFLIVCNFIESLFNNLEKADLEDLYYLQNKLLSFEKNNNLKNCSVSEMYDIKPKRYKERIRYLLFFEYYEILIKYLILIKEELFGIVDGQKIKNDHLNSKIQCFISLIFDLRSNYGRNDFEFDLFTLMQYNVRLIIPKLMIQNEKIIYYQNLLKDFNENPNLKESQLIISFHLSDLYYKQNQYEKAINIIIPMMKILNEEIFIEENPFATKLELHEYLMLLCLRIINSSYYLNKTDLVIKYLKELNQFLMILKKSKTIDKENPEIKLIIKRYECMISIFLNMNLESSDSTKLNECKEEITNNINVKSSENIISYLDQFKSNNFLPFENSRPNEYRNILSNQNLTREDLQKIDFDKFLNYFMNNFAKQVSIAKDKKDNNIAFFIQSNSGFLNSINLYLEEILLKKEFGINLNQNRLIEVNNQLYRATSIEKYFQIIIGYYNLIYYYNTLLINEKTDQKKKTHYLINLKKLCDTFHNIFKKLFAPVLLTTFGNSNNNIVPTPRGDNDIFNSNVNSNIDILKMLIENTKIKHLILKIFIANINLFKYEKKFEEGLKQYDLFEMLLLNFDLNDNLSQSLYFGLMKLKADYLIRTNNYIDGLNFYFEILRILDKKNDNFIEDRAIILFNTGFAYLLKLRNSVTNNEFDKSAAKEDVRKIKNYIQESLNLFETIKYNRENTNAKLSNFFCQLII